MPPEEIARQAALYGMPVEHFADHSIVHTPDGPMPIAHGPSLSSHPSAVLPPRDAAPTAPAAAPAPSHAHARPTRHIVFADDPGGGPIPGGDALQTVRHLDAMRAQAEEGARQERLRQFEAEEAQQLARIEDHGRTPEQERTRELEAREAREAQLPTVGADGTLPPEWQRFEAQQEEMQRQIGDLSGMIGSGSLHRAATAHGVAPRPARDAARVTASPEAQDRVTADLMTQRPDLGYGPEAVVGPRPTAPAAPPPPAAPVPVGSADPSALGSIAASAPGSFVPSDAPIDTSGRTPQAGAWVDDGIMGAPRAVPGDPTSPPIASSAAGGATAPHVGGPRRVGGAIPMPPTQPGMPLPAPASDAMIGQLAGDYAPARRAPDLVDRQQFLDQQVAAAGREDAIRQAAAEREAEQQRQALEQDRAHAMLGARQAYQNAIERVSSARLDPSRWFRDQGAGGTIAATLAVGLGALGQAFSGGDRNLALEEINQAIDRDIEAQGADIESGRAAADLQGNMLGIMRSEYGDRDAAREAARAAMLRQVALQTQAHTADLADDEARLHADQTRAQLEQAANEADAAAVTQELAWRQSAAQTARLEAQAAHEQRLAFGGGGAPRPHPPTHAIMQAYNDWMQLHPGHSHEEGWSIVGGEGPPPSTTGLYVPMSSAEAGTAASVSSALDDLERVAAMDDIPGVGAFDSLFSAVPGSEAALMRQRITNTVDAIIRQRSGANAPEAELAMYRGLLNAGNEAEFRNYLGIIRRDQAARLGRTASGDAAPDRDLADVGGEWVE